MPITITVAARHGCDLKSQTERRASGRVERYVKSLGLGGRGVSDGAAALVSREAIELVFRLCEQQPAEISWHVLNMHFDRLGEELIAAGALWSRRRRSETIVMPMDLDDELVGFEWDADRQAFVGFHPNMGLVEADPRVRKQYRVNFDWLLSAIAGAAGVAAGQRRVCLVGDQLWDLGDARLRSQQSDRCCSLAASALADALDLVERALIARQGRADGVLLTTSPRISRAVRLPGRHRILQIRDCLDHASRHFALDADVIAGSRSEAGARRARTRSRWNSAAAGSEFAGENTGSGALIQRSIVQQVYEAWRDGAGRLRTQEVLETAESSVEGSWPKPSAADPSSKRSSATTTGSAG